MKSIGLNIFVGLVAGAWLSAMSPVMAADAPATGVVVDSEGKVIRDASGDCLVAPNQPDNRVAAGCIVDSDGDGVPDSKDKCPDTPKGVKVDENGCPLDSDGDGVPDYKDKCPNNTKEEISKGVDADGCPKDSDGDGVPDYRDKCPGTPKGAKVDKDGCTPAQDKIEVSLGEDMVNFAFDKATLTAKGKTVLDNLAQQAMNAKEVTVEGHTDSVGSDAYNQKLSEKRAKVVADYLKSKGVPAAKMKVVGKGEKAPIADNKTKEGRAKNRRVVVTVQIR